jgi:hypothetical protein
MKQSFVVTFACAVLLQLFFITCATCQPVPENPKPALSDPTRIEQIVRKTVPMQYAPVGSSKNAFKAEQRQDEVHWIKRHPVLGGMVIGVASGFAVGFARCLGEHDLTVAGAMVICGGYGAAIGAGAGALVGKVISERD